MNRYSGIDPVENGYVNAIIESPRDSYLKYDFDEKRNLFVANKILPVGMSFPLDFGFIPGTRGEDGDPLDILIFMDQPGLQGTLVSCRLLGYMSVIQKEPGGTPYRNDRYLAVAQYSRTHAHLTEATDLGEPFLRGLEMFFINYNLASGKEFTARGWKKAAEAMTTLLQSP